MASIGHSSSSHDANRVEEIGNQIEPIEDINRKSTQMIAKNMKIMNRNDQETKSKGETDHHNLYHHNYHRNSTDEGSMTNT